ncbi:MAG TPA: hypothetical protein P5079_09505 [Elusimicrobiota bacterium]|nr:hypothetical protein [Elusimicrobiota bacterium]
MNVVIAVTVASIIWFVLAGALFFNPLVEPIYNSEENSPAVKKLPKTPKTMGLIMAAILAQTILWALVFKWLSPHLYWPPLSKGLFFGLMLTCMKMVPRDVDRLLLTTYPLKRMAVEFIIGTACSFVIGLTFAFIIR